MHSFLFPRAFGLGLSSRAHQHSLLAITRQGGSQRRPFTILHYWYPSSVELLSVRTNITQSELEYIGGLQELGQCGPVELHELLTSVLLSQADIFSTPTSSVIAAINRSSSAPVPLSSTLFCISSISVYSETPLDKQQGSYKELAWKWEKPHSIYDRKSGRWEINPREALEDGIWSGGKELDLVVRLVNTEMAEAINNGMKIC